jgi:hypothetical protein
MPDCKCCVCDKPFQFGPQHIYNGRPVQGWGGLMVCRQCEKDYHDGIVPAHYPHLVSRIKAAGGKVSFNEAGFIAVLS